MDLDTYSPHPRCQRFSSVKRARSPDSSIFEDRPSKRIHYAALDVQRRLGDYSTGSSRQSSEDWVQQARSLSIDSPLYSAHFISEEAAKVERIEDDEHMMSVSNSQSSREFDKSQLPLLQSSGYPAFPSAQQVPDMDMPCGLDGPSVPYINVNSVEDHSLQASVKQDQRFPQQTLPERDPIMGTSINAVPPTLMEHLGVQACLHSGSMSASNSDTSTQTDVPPSKLATPKKQRFMMGPRADCMKCRMGVKGHFVHLD
ncbi:hypothetical protein AGABI2DRAFT_115532 [Agaricus bisporus var. bisporus H97]|uniref:hypothetical protein n=1 Tax=Agaricus bisporus var. bisporus (strain H97 / ATCC MYA-4626 / FGSC 10389) TaxID=936046 RepID=UPI00029F74BF|nr:hypothetical protein AGABI2DRAFT_115532 [Agaricus bisporus var. bisporus H97]EKV50460.1 hypothetical protein AGABI2DRAFT_115532 [Agaricus bisporus var. bisporus H97]